MESRPASAPPTGEQDWWWIFDPRLSLRALATLVVGGTTLGFTLLTSAVSGGLFHQAIERQVGGAYEALAFQMSDKLDRVIAQRHRDLSLVAAQAPFRTADAPAAERRRVLEALQDATRDFAWLGFADAQGRVRAASRGMLENTAVDGRPWFRLGRERPHFGGLSDIPALAQEISQTADHSMLKFIELAVPITAADGQFLGVLAAFVHWEWAREVQLSVVPEAARRELIGLTVYGAASDVLLDSGASGWTQPPEAPAIPDARRFRGSLVEATSGGTQYLTGFARSRGYREFRGLGWLVTVRQPADLAFAPATDLKRRINGWGFLLTLFLMITTWIATGRLTRRLRAIGLAADRIREGDILTVLPQPRGEGELARMCGALGRMVERLRAQDPAAAPPTPANPARPPDQSRAG